MWLFLLVSEVGVLYRLSVKLKQAAGLKNHIVSDVQVKRDNLDSLQPKLNAVMQVSVTVSQAVNSQTILGQL